MATGCIAAGMALIASWGLRMGDLGAWLSQQPWSQNLGAISAFFVVGTVLAFACSSSPPPRHAVRLDFPAQAPIEHPGAGLLASALARSCVGVPARQGVHQPQPAGSRNLRQRIEELEQRAGRTKVLFGLGQISASSYRLIIENIDRERGAMESQLLRMETHPPG